MQSSFLGSGLRSSTQRCFAPSRVSPKACTVVAHYGGRVNLGGGKAWERTETNQNGKPVKVKMHVKKGDVVQVRVLADERCCCCCSAAAVAAGAAALSGRSRPSRQVSAVSCAVQTSSSCSCAAGAMMAVLQQAARSRVPA